MTSPFCSLSHAAVDSVPKDTKGDIPSSQHARTIIDTSRHLHNHHIHLSGIRVSIRNFSSGDLIYIIIILKCNFHIIILAFIYTFRSPFLICSQTTVILNIYKYIQDRPVSNLCVYPPGFEF